jgi:protease-4
MLFILFQILFLPFKIIYFIYLRISVLLFSRGNHIYIHLPSKFSKSVKSTLVQFFSDEEEDILLFEYLMNFEKIIKNDKIKYVSLFIPSQLDYGYAELYQIITSLEKLKSSGKEIRAYTPRGDLKNLLLLSYSDKRFIPEYAEFSIILPSSENYFFGGLFKKLGIEIESYTSGAYKSYSETYTRDKFSKEAKSNLAQLIRSIRTQILEILYENTKIDSSFFKKINIQAVNLKNEKFITEFLDEENFTNHYTKENYDSEKDDLTKRISLRGSDFYFKLKAFKFIKKKLKKLVILPISGAINLGKESSKDLKSDKIESYSLSLTLRELREDESIDTVILEIDSPGGSAEASEIIHREILKLKAKKKVIAYFQNVAASGGYYIATASDKIYSTPLTITGSIGAFLIRGNLKSFYNRLGITKDRIEFYPLRDIYSEYGELSEESKQYLNSEIKRVNGIFYQRVIDSRKKSLKEMSKLGEGRVFTGKTFLASGMVDGNLSLIQLLNQLEEESNQKFEYSYFTSTQSLRASLRENIGVLTSILKWKNEINKYKFDNQFDYYSYVSEKFYKD